MSRPASHPFARALLATLTLALAATLALAQPLPDLALDPPVDEAMLRPDLAEAVRAATVWLFEEGDDAVEVWVWRVPGDPDPEGLFDHNPWADGGETMVRDLGETMRSTVDVFGAFFDETDPGWSERAQALAQQLTGVEQRQAVYTVIDGEGEVFYGVQVSDGFVDLRALAYLEGTWVQLTLLRE
jgi:hypothetical protein